MNVSSFIESAAFNKDEFYNLEDIQLNLCPENGSLTSTWGNLGYWSPNIVDESTLPNACAVMSLDLNCPDAADLIEVYSGEGEGISYAQACENLAHVLANVSGLSGRIRSTTGKFTLLDTGFGCGDQLCLWLNVYGVTDLYGINISTSQTQVALARLDSFYGVNAAGDGSVSYQLKVGDCCQSSNWQHVPLNLTDIFGLDCVYHFADQAEYFRLCEKHLAPHGQLTISDLVLNRPLRNPFHQALLKLICYFSHIPYSQLKTFSGYQKSLAQAGLTIRHAKDLSEGVFLPFGHWLSGFISEIDKSKVIKKKPRWLKYKGTAMFLRWLYKNQILSYQVLRIEKTVHG